MNRIIVGILAVVIAVSAFSFTRPKINKNNFDTFYYQYTGTNPLNISSYAQLTAGGGLTPAQKFAALNCTSGSTMCGIQTNTTSPTLTNNGSGFPAINSSVLVSAQKH